MNVRRGIVLAAAALIVAILAWLHYDMLWEAYGSGPPYYGRTTNMDKWSSPWPVLLVADGICAAALFVLSRWRG
jgi:hypothetical protein